jgi:adenylate cyclase class 2
MHRILAGAGFEIAYRYQKYRTGMRLGALGVFLDETPLGCFVELEGPPEAIDAAAAELGFAVADYVTESYRELHERAREEGAYASRDMLFGAQEPDDP